VGISYEPKALLFTFVSSDVSQVKNPTYLSTGCG
jgi:hypothetical protein